MFVVKSALKRCLIAVSFTSHYVNVYGNFVVDLRKPSKGNEREPLGKVYFIFHKHY